MARSYASTVIEAPAGRVWARIRDFNSLPVWNPGPVAGCEIEEGKAGDQVGAVRRVSLADGTSLRERLLSHSDAERSFSYNFEQAPFDVDNYHATLRVTPITDGDRSFVEWWNTFECDRDRIEYWQDVFANQIFQGGFEALKLHFQGEMS